MSEPLDKVALVRQAWLTELRRQGHRQCTNGSYESNMGQLVCALGLLREVALPDWHPHDRESIDDVGDVGALGGLSYDQSYEVAARNDGDHALGFDEPYDKHSFAEIADIVDGWFANG